MSCGVQRRQVSAHARPDQGDPSVPGGLFQDAELRRNREMLEIARGQVGDGDRRAGGSQRFLEAAGFARQRSGRKPVQVNDVGHPCHSIPTNNSFCAS